MTNIPLITIMMLTMMMGGISNINAITHNTTITNEDDGSIDKSKFDWGPVNGPEPEQYHQQKVLLMTMFNLTLPVLFPKKK